MISPTPGKSFAIGTYFRDASDSTGDPSLIAFVDPPGEADGTAPAAEFPSDWIRRGNYGAWLIGMGFTESGNALRNGTEIRLPARQIPVVNLGGRSFGVTIEGLVVKRNRRIRGPYPMFWLDPSFYRRASLSSISCTLFARHRCGGNTCDGHGTRNIAAYRKFGSESGQQSLLEHNAQITDMHHRQLATDSPAAFSPMARS